MSIDYSGFAIPKGTPRVLERRKKRLTEAEAERECRKEVRARYGWKCVVPGCKDEGSHLHHLIRRSRSKKQKWNPDNLVPLCPGHHQLEHAGKISLRRDEHGELIVEGPKDMLSFKL